MKTASHVILSVAKDLGPRERVRATEILRYAQDDTGLRGVGGAFTLVEVLAAMVLMGIVLPVAMRGVSLALAAAETARHTAEAASFAETKLNELVAEGLATSGNVSGDFSAEQHPEYQWVCQSTPRDYGTIEVMLQVTWIERGQPRQLNVTTLTSDSATGALP